MAKSRAQQAAIAISMKKRGKKPKKLRKGGFDLLKKYQPGGFSNFGQIEYGPNILQVPGADADAQKYLQLTTSNFQQGVENRENQLLATQQYYQQLADAEANQNISSGTAQLLNKVRTAEEKDLEIKQKIYLQILLMLPYMQSLLILQFNWVERQQVHLLPI